jgi:hypothetical protein
MSTAAVWEEMWTSRFGTAYSDRAFKENFYVTATECAYIWLNLLLFLSVADGAQPFLQVHLLMALNFLKEYPTTSAGAAKFRVDPKTYRVWVWKLIHLMAGALKEVFFASRFGAAIPDGLLQGICMVLDTTPFPIQRPKDDETQRTFYSVKYGYHCFKYEIMCRMDGLIVWFTTGAPGSVSDPQILQHGGLYDLLLPDELFLADMIYSGRPHAFTQFRKIPNVPFTAMQLAVNAEVEHHRKVIENVNGRLKNWGCLNSAWRHDLELHQVAFTVCAQITNIQTRSEPVRR